MVDSVYFFWPNLVGYVRILLAGIAFYQTSSNIWAFLLFYSLSQLLDAVDGYLARLKQQETRFGAILDMITDRASTACLWLGLVRHYPQYIILFQLCLSIDIVSHFSFYSSTLLTGKNSHKMMDNNNHPLLRYYYNNRSILFMLCLGQELVILLFYVLAKALENPHCSVMTIQLIYVAIYFMFPFCLLKQMVNLIQMQQAMKIIVAIDVEERSKFKASKVLKHQAEHRK